ncbi:MAG: FkbM family methyltransferase [Candidatus Hodarchaeales archaeon]|jgi:FkbM family methyltransferase
MRNIWVQLIAKEYVKVQEFYMYTNYSLRNQLVRDAYEPTTTALIKRIIQPGEVVVDLGSNIGYFTLLMAKLVGNKGKVYTFEPEPRNFSLLKKNMILNRYKNITLEQKAVSNKNEKIPLILGAESSHRVTFDSAIKENIEYVEAVSLDNYFGNTDKKIALIKMDIEGSEYHAIKGMDSILSQNKDILLISEFYPELLLHFNIQPKEYLELLESYSFKFFDINDQNKKVDRTTKTKLLKKYDKDLPFTNLFLKR